MPIALASSLLILRRDGSFADAKDDLQIDDNFNDSGGTPWAQMTLTGDHAGNLTDDGVLLYVYDAWNRGRKRG